MFSEAPDALASLLWAFSARLRERIEERRYDRVFFLSREGLILYRAYVAAHRGRGSQAMSYLLASRRSLGLATCWRLRDCDRLLDVPFHPQPLRQLLESRFGITGTGGNAAHEVLVSKHQKRVIRKSLRQHRSQILLRAHVERQGYLRHLAARGMHAKGRYLLVDIGYNGTYHRAFQRLLPNADFESFCIAAFPGAAQLVERKRIHTLLPGIRDNRLKRDVFSRNVACVELMLMAPHPSFLSVAEEGDGQLRFHFEDRHLVPPPEIRHLQQQALDRVRVARQNGLKDVAGAIHRFESWLATPPLDDVQIFAGLRLDDRYGGKIGRSAIAAEVLPASAELTFEQAVHFYEQSEWKDGALRLLAGVRIAPPTVTSGDSRSKLYKRLRRMFRSREAFLHHARVLAQKWFGTYVAPNNSRRVVASLVSD